MKKPLLWTGVVCAFLVSTGFVSPLLFPADAQWYFPGQSCPEGKGSNVRMMNVKFFTLLLKYPFCEIL